MSTEKIEHRYGSKTSILSPVNLEHSTGNQMLTVDVKENDYFPTYLRMDCMCILHEAWGELNTRE